MDSLTQRLMMAATNQGDPMRLEFRTTLSSGTTVFIPLRGSASCAVFWGDGTQTTVNTSAASPVTHTYAAEGTYEVRIYGRLSAFGGNVGVRTGFEKLYRVISFGQVGLVDLFNAFSQAVNLAGLPDTLPSTVTSLEDAFSFLSTFNLDIGSWDTSSVTNMDGLFLVCSAFNRDISGWNTSNVTDMSNMFNSAAAFNQDLSSWVTGLTSQPTDFSANATAWTNPAWRPYLSDGTTQINT